VLRKNKRGFTLVELLVVVIILGILAAVVVPQFTDHTNDARLASLDTNLAEMRSAIELYYHQHNGMYPGQIRTNGTVAVAANMEQTFRDQLTQFTDIDGNPAPERTDPNVQKFGPYLRKSDLPANPFTGDATLVADAGTTSLAADLFDGGQTSAWKFAVQIGKFIANDNGDHSKR